MPLGPLNFLLVRRNNGLLDGGFFVEPTTFYGAEDSILLQDTTHTLPITWQPITYPTPLGKFPFLSLPTTIEYNNGYRSWEGYIPDNIATSGIFYKQGLWEYTVRTLTYNGGWGKNLYELTLSGETPFGIGWVPLPLQFNDSDAIIESNASLLEQEGQPAPEVDPNYVIDFSNTEFSDNQFNGQTFTVLELAENKFLFSQTTPSTEWLIEHDLGVFPKVKIINGVNPVLGRVIHEDANKLRVEFNTALSGEAYLGA
jgi:hypothetical protein